MVTFAYAVVAYLRALFLTRHRLALEAVVLRQQLAVFKRMGASNRAWLLGLLRAVFHAFGEPEDMLGRSHTSSESRVDGTDGA